MKQLMRKDYTVISKSAAILQANEVVKLLALFLLTSRLWLLLSIMLVRSMHKYIKSRKFKTTLAMHNRSAESDFSLP